MTKVMEQIIYWMMVTAGFAVWLAWSLMAFWWAIGQIIKSTGHWKLFYRAVIIAGKQINDEKRSKK